MGSYTRPVSRQRLGKQVPRATNRCAKMDAGFSVRSVPRRCKQGARFELRSQFCTGVCEEDWSPEGEE
jgi:hypothetical protein